MKNIKRLEGDVSEIRSVHYALKVGCPPVITSTEPTVIAEAEGLILEYETVATKPKPKKEERSDD